MSKSFWVIGTNWQGNLHFTPLACINYRLAKGKELSFATLHFPDRSHTIIKICKPVRTCHSTFNQFLGKIFFAGMCDCMKEYVNKLFVYYKLFFHRSYTVIIMKGIIFFQYRSSKFQICIIFESHWEMKSVAMK